MDDIKLLELVHSQHSDENIKAIIDYLLIIISDGINFQKDVLEPLTFLLDNFDLHIQSLAAQSIAELCKCDKKRICYSQNNIVKKLLDNFNQSITIENAELVKQSCRALGNICYESYVGRDLILKLKGVPVIVELLPKTLKHSNDQEDPFHDVRLFACKLLLVLMLGGNEYIEPALEVDFLNKIHTVINYEFLSANGDDDRLHKAVLILSVVTEYCRSLVVDKELTLLVVDILKTVKNMEISEVCLEYLHYQAEHDEIKTVLANAAVPQILWNLLEKYRSLAIDDESRELMKAACGLIALILTGDAAMNLLYANGEGDFYTSMIDSLNLEDKELSITAILAVGNFARTDTHCMQMMNTGVFNKLMGILSLHKTQEDDIRLQHAVLSGLRNLVIPQKNKSLAVEHGILPLLIEMIPNITQYHVVFKLLATLRMLVDGQELVAEELVSSNTLEHVAKWASQTEHNGVSGESSRLLARIVRQLQPSLLIKKVVLVNECVSCQVNMLAASHAIMQNEALIALTIMCCVCFSDKCKDNEYNDSNSHNYNTTIQNGDDSVLLKTNKIENELALKTVETFLVNELIKANFEKQLCIMLENNCNKMQSEIADNVVKFLSTLIKKDELKEKINKSEICKLMEKLLLTNDSLTDTVKTNIKELTTKINDKTV